MGGLPHHTLVLEGKAGSRNIRSLSISARPLSACTQHMALKSQQAANRDNSLYGSDVCLSNSRKISVKQIPDVRRSPERMDGASTAKMLLLALAEMKLQSLVSKEISFPRIIFANITSAARKKSPQALGTTTSKMGDTQQTNRSVHNTDSLTGGRHPCSRSSAIHHCITKQAKDNRRDIY